MSEAADPRAFFLPSDRVIVALDLDSLTDALGVVEALGERCTFYKIGPRLFYREGPSAVAKLVDEGKKVFLDLKAHDIPSVVESATLAAIDSGATFFTAHVAGGSAAAAVRAAGRRSTGSTHPFFVLGVTVLTSIDESALATECPSTSLEDLLESRTAGVVRAGCDGVVSAVSDLPHIRHLLPGRTLKVCPGIRPSPAGPDRQGPFLSDSSKATGDQARTATPSQAAEQGADFIVVGRPVVASPDPAAAFAAILDDFLG